MTVRRINAKQRTMRKTCDWCGEPSTLRGYGWAKTSCALHEPELTAWDRKEQTPDYSDAAFYGRY